MQTWTYTFHLTEQQILSKSIDLKWYCCDKRFSYQLQFVSTGQGFQLKNLCFSFYTHTSDVQLLCCENTAIIFPLKWQWVWTRQFTPWWKYSVDADREDKLQCSALLEMQECRINSDVTAKNHCTTLLKTWKMNSKTGRIWIRTTSCREDKRWNMMLEKLKAKL